jgi:protein-disulfide isomerase
VLVRERGLVLTEMSDQHELEPEPRTRRLHLGRRWTIALAVVAGAAVIVAALALAGAFTGGSSSKSSTSTLPRLTHADEVQQLFDGIEQRGDVLGSASAPVTMVEYFDLQCPFCQLFARYSLPEVISRYVREGKLKLELRPLGTLGPDSQRGRLALVAAGRQDREFQLAHLLDLNAGAENSGWLSDDMIQRAAASVDGLDTDRFAEDLASVDVMNQVGRYDREAVDDKVQFTPTILVGKTGGTLRRVEVTNPSAPEPVIAAIEAALRGS